MSAAEQMREAAAVLVEDAVRMGTRDASAPPLRAEDVVISRADLAAAIRALALAEEAPLTPREKLRRVRDARELLATARIAVPRRGYVVSATTRECLGDWTTRGDKGNHIGRAWARKGAGVVYTDLEGGAARTWVLDTLRVEGWDVVEDGEGDG